MARPPKITTDDILDAAADAAVARWRDATVADVAERLGVPAGSVFYRYATREDLFVSVWLRAIRRFHVGLLEAAQNPDADAALLTCALHIPRFCREHPADAVAMTLYRQPELAESAPAALRDDVVHINDDVFRAMSGLAQRRYGHTDERHLMLVAVAAQESPYGLVRRYLRSGRPIPAELDEIVAAATTAILALGDVPGPAADATP